jgi:hypothetical protein
MVVKLAGGEKGPEEMDNFYKIVLYEETISQCCHTVDHVRAKHFKQCFGSPLTLCGSGSSFLGECESGSGFANECESGSR